MKHSTIRTISIFLLILQITAFFLFSMETGYAASSCPLSQSTLSVGSYNASTLPAGENSSRKIRVAQIDLSNFYSYDRLGPIGGYGFEYLEEISKYTGWEYQFVPVTLEHGLELLQSGELDLLAPVTDNAALRKRFDYSDQEIGLCYSVLCVAVEDTKTAVNDFSAINGMKVGMLKNAAASSGLASFSQKNKFQVETITFENQATLLRALHDNKIDAILINSLEKRPTERIVCRFDPVPYYYITAKGNEDILDPLNAALNSMKEMDPYYDYELEKKYYDWDSTPIPIFTKAEKEFIKKAGVLKAVYDPVWAPIEYHDENTGSFSGINADVFRLISEMTGLRFSFIKTDSYSDALKRITNYEADILTGVDSDVHWADQHNFMLTDSYLSASIVLVKNKKVTDLETARAALAKDFLAATEYVKRSSPAADIVYYSSPQACFEAVNNGDADITYANSYVAELLLENPKLNNLAIVETVNLSDLLCIGVSDSVDPILLSILNKSIRGISDSQMNNIIFKHTINDLPEISFEYLLYKYPRYLFTILIVFFLMIITAMVIIIAIKNYHNKEIKKVAYLDSVTGTWNYNKFKQDAQALLKSARNKEYAIVYLDINKFSYVNDTFGYGTGDIILAEVAGVLERLTKDSECSARISADNFVCLLEYESDDAVIKRALEFQKKCNEHLTRISSRFKIQLTAAAYKVSRGETDIPSLVGKADIAHKTIGEIHNSSIVFYDDRIQREFLRKKKLESAMAASLERGDFLVYLQPKVDLVSRKIVGAEALARWQHPTEGLIMPDQFIPLFESNGFILELDFYIYERVCRLIRRWINAGETAMPVSVNVSKAHLTNPQFATQLKALIDRYQISPDLLELELTESILFNSLEADIIIRNLKELGFPILIDDFGSGYSSLNLLKDLTVDVLKLDKEFFRKGVMAEKDKIIVGGIIRIANDLNLKILSEGVETQEHVDFLLESGCHMAQGYFFARPMPVADFENMIGYR